MRFRDCNVFLQTVSDGFIHYTLHTLQTKTVYYCFYLNRQIHYEATQNCYPDYQQGLSSG